MVLFSHLAAKRAGVCVCHRQSACSKALLRLCIRTRLHRDACALIGGMADFE